MLKWVVSLMVLSILVMPCTVLAQDGINIGSWPPKLSDGWSATDYRFQSMNYWPKRIPVWERETAADERYYIESFKPVVVEYPKEAVSSPFEVQYVVPPSLDKIQAIRWGQALPSARAYLARLWDIPVEEAVKYGASY